MTDFGWPVDRGDPKSVISPQDAQSGVLLLRAPARADEQPDQEADHHDAQRREQDREERGEQRGGLGVQRQRGARVGVEPAADAGEEVARGDLREAGAGEPEDQPVPPRPVPVVEGAGVEQRAQAERDAADERARGAGLEVLATGLEHERHGAGERDDDQEDRRLQEGELGAVEVDAEVGDRQAAGDERGQERPQAGGAGHARALEQIEEQSHDWGTVALASRMPSQPPKGPGSAHELERYAGLFSSRTRVMKSSAMRDLMALTERPEVISLAGGLPDTSTFPPELLAKLMSGVAAESSARALQYGPTEGSLAAREAIVEVMAEEGTHVDPQDVLVTTGGQQVIDLVCKAFIDPGDVIVAEAPTYPGAVPTFSAYQADVVQIAMDDDGMRVDELEETLARLEREGRRPKFIYTVPSFQNPAGVTLSLPRRKRLVEVAAERELLVLEDNPYGLLRYEGEPLPTLHSLDGGRYVVYLGTFSKILSPGIRLGWAAAPGPVFEKLNLGKQASDLCSSSLSQAFVAAYFAHADWRDYLTVLRGVYRKRRDVMLEALEEFLPAEAHWTRPGGGLFIWATLPDYIDTTDLLARALDDNVAFVPGRQAYLDGRGGSSMRLNFSGVSEDDIREGVRRIGKVVREQLELFGTLTGRPPAQPAPAEAPPGDVVPMPYRRRRA